MDKLILDFDNKRTKQKDNNKSDQQVKKKQVNGKKKKTPKHKNGVYTLEKFY